VRVAQTIIANSRRVFLACDHTKFGRSAMVRLGSIEQVDELFTDCRPAAAYRDLLTASEVVLHVAVEAPLEGATRPA
jgi:DeoR family glycerol-3-phosphate regulon repressor